MAIQALALLCIDGIESRGDKAPRVQQLDDCVLLHTGASFGSEPAELTARVRGQLGDAIVDRHRDPRGIFYVPDVAAPQARSYEAVIAEVGEGGMWGPAGAPAVMLPDSLGASDLGALLDQIPGSLLEAVSELTRRDPNVLHEAGKQLEALIGRTGPQGVSELLGSAGMELSGGDLQQLVAGMQQELQAHPNRLADLAEQLLGGMPPGAEEADEDQSDDD